MLFSFWGDVIAIGIGASIRGALLRALLVARCWAGVEEVYAEVTTQKWYYGVGLFSLPFVKLSNENTVHKHKDLYTPYPLFPCPFL